MFYGLLNLLTWENFLKSLKLSDAEIKRLKVIEERFVMRVFNVIKNRKQQQGRHSLRTAWLYAFDLNKFSAYISFLQTNFKRD